MDKQKKRIEQVKFEDIIEVSFEDFEKTMKQIVKVKPPQKKPPIRRAK